MTASVVNLEIQPQSKEEKRLSNLLHEVAEIYRERVFPSFTLPFVKYRMPNDATGSGGFFELARYVCEEKTLHFNLGAIIARTREPQERDLFPDMNFSQALNTAMTPFLGEVSDLELKWFIGKLLAEHLVYTTLVREYPSSWLLKKSEKSHEEFSRDLVSGGVVEYLTRFVVPNSELVSDSIWKTYDEDPDLEDDNNTRWWFTSKGGFNLVEEILNISFSNGFRYLSEEPLRINRHFGLASVPRYKRNALKALALQKTS